MQTLCESLPCSHLVLLFAFNIKQWKDGREYVGEYRDDLRHGHGVFTYANGTRYEGCVCLLPLLYRFKSRAIS
jgi:hypothetical protein